MMTSPPRTSTPPRPRQIRDQRAWRLALTTERPTTKSMAFGANTMTVTVDGLFIQAWEEEEKGYTGVGVWAFHSIDVKHVR